MTEDLLKIKNYLNQKFIVCPKPGPWSRLYNIIETRNSQNARDNNCKRIDIKEPLIFNLSGASDKLKLDVFNEHLLNAQQLNILSDVTEYLYSLNDSLFHYSRELSVGKPISEIGWDDEYSRYIDITDEIVKDAKDLVIELTLIKPDLTEERLIELLKDFQEGKFAQRYEDEIKVRQQNIEIGNFEESDIEDVTKLVKNRLKFKANMATIYEKFMSQKDLEAGDDTLSSFCHSIFYFIREEEDEEKNHGRIIFD